MLAMFKRDVKLIFSSKDTLILLLIYIPFLMFVLESYVPEILYFAILVFYTYLISMNNFKYDITGKNKYIINSLPIKREEQVIYRYISLFVYFIFTVVYSGVYLWIISLLNIADVDYFNLKWMLNAIPAVMIYAAIGFPAYFRFEPKIAQIFNIIIFISFFMIIGNMHIAGTNGIMRYISVLKYEYILIIALVIYILSLILSINIYKKRDI